MRRFVLSLLFGLGLVLLAVYALIGHHRSHSGLSPDQIRHYADHIALLERVESQYRERHFPEGLQALEAQRARFMARGVPDQLRLGFFLLKGKLHWSLWQYVEADKAWLEAEKYAHTTRQQRILATLVRDSRRVLDDVNRERNTRDVYRASPHTGPAAELRGRIALLYIFLVDGAGAGWSLRDRTYVLDTWRMAGDWLSRQSKLFGTEVHFSRRIFLVDRNPQILRLRVGDSSNSFRNVDNVAMLAAQQFGYTSLLAMSEDIKRQEHADQAMVILHLARDGRSFASRCMHRCADAGEFAVLLESARRKKWQALQYAQAHESLHLFGADDLYNIRGAKYFEVRDIMNYPSSLLQASTLESLTAWAVGLETHRPMTPFRIKTYH